MVSRPQEMPTDSEEMLHDTVNRREPLELSGRRETPHLALTLSGRHCQVNESGTYEGRLIRDQAAVTAVHTVNARARNIR